MSGFDTNNDPNQIFSQDSIVEVSSDEEGFKGAWFRAKVVENPNASASKKRKKVLVEYGSLVTEDGSKALREHVDLGYLRPLPPEVGTRDFEVGDVVDADYRDGWWTGVVKKVLGNSKYVVFFDNPPDLIEFEQKEMRVHQDWVSGKWVRPKREQQMAGSTFSSGTPVEVNIDNEELSDAWIPAIVLKENDDNTFLVKYPNTKAKIYNNIVDSLHIRPTVPVYAVRTYELREKVEAFCDSVWRAGEITKLLPGKMYTVTFRHGIKSNKLGGAEIRPLMKWKDGKWDVESKEGLVASNSNLQEESEHIPNDIHDVDMASQPESLGVADCNNEKRTPHPINSEKNLIEQSTECNGESVSSLSAPNHGGRVHSSKNLEDKVPTESPLSDKVKQETLGRSATSARAQTRSGRLRKPVVPFNMEPNVKRNKRPKVGGDDIKGIDSVTRKGRSKPFQVKRTSISAVGKAKNASTGAAEKVVEKEVVSKEAELSIIASSTEDMQGSVAENPRQSLNEKLPKLPRDLKKNSKDPTEENGTRQSLNEELPKLPRDLKKNSKDPAEENSTHQSLNEEFPKLPMDLIKNLKDPAEENSTEFKQQSSGGSSSKRKRGRPRKLVVLALGSEASVGAKHHNGAGHVEESVVKACSTNEVSLLGQGGEETAGTGVCGLDVISNLLLGNLLSSSVAEAADQSNLQDASRAKKAAVSGTNGMTNEAGIVSVRPSNSVDDDDRPLSMWFGGMQCQPGVTEAKSVGKTVEQRNKDRERANSAKKTSAFQAFNGSLPEENQRLPFVKSSPIWKAIESMEVFTMMPQVPHFRPLYKCKEECREGLAIGNMVTFSGLVDKISKLQFDDRGSIFTSTLESLADLEKHGFNVSVLRSRVTDLLSMKDRQERFRNESKDAQNKIKEHAGEKTKLAEEIDDISKKISELQEKHALMKAQMESKDEETAKLQQHVDSVNQNINSARLEFEKLAATPFKSL